MTEKITTATATLAAANKAIQVSLQIQLIGRQTYGPIVAAQKNPSLPI